MEALFITLLKASLFMTLIGFGYKLMSPFLEKYAKVRMRYNGWILIFLCLVIPVRPQIILPIFQIDVPSAILMFETVNEIPLSHAFEPGNSLEVVQVMHSDTAMLANTSQIPQTQSVSILAVIIGIWLIGVVVFLGYHFIKHYRYIRHLLRWQQKVTDESVLTMFKALKRELNVATEVELIVSPVVTSPLVTGVIRPTIVLPHKNFDKETLHFILKHELIHFKQKDVWVRCLILIATALHWFNPFMTFMAKESKNLCEMACDWDVINGYEDDLRETYVLTILSVIKQKNCVQSPLVTQFNGGKKSMKNRIITIMDKGEKKLGMSIMAALLLLVVTTGVVLAVNETSPNADADTFLQDARDYVDETLTGYDDEGVYEGYALFDQADTDEFDEVFTDVSPGSAVGANWLTGEGEMIGQIYMPSINVELPIFEGLNNDNLSVGAGTSVPYAQMGAGNFVLAAHWNEDAAMFFGGIHLIQVGDLIILENDEYRFIYEVIIGDNHIIEAYRVDILDYVPGKRYVTLFTCTPDGHQRVKVRGELIDVVSR